MKGDNVARRLSRNKCVGYRDVARLSIIADRIAVKKREHNAQADEWSARLDAMDTAEPGAFAIGDAVVAEREQDLARIESDMKQLSNLPPIANVAATNVARDISLMPAPATRQLRREKRRK